MFRPELFADFVAFLPKGERSDPLQGYLRRLSDPDPTVHAPAARMWNAYERALSTLTPRHTRLDSRSAGDGRLPPTPFMEAHFIRNDFFLAPGQLLREATQLKGIPGVIVQGRYDLLCPPISAYALTEVWTDCRLQIMENAGHCMSEPGVAEAMAEAVCALSGK